MSPACPSPAILRRSSKVGIWKSLSSGPPGDQPAKNSMPSAATGDGAAGRTACRPPTTSRRRSSGRRRSCVVTRTATICLPPGTSPHDGRAVREAGLPLLLPFRVPVARVDGEDLGLLSSSRSRITRPSAMIGETPVPKSPKRVRRRHLELPEFLARQVVAEQAARAEVGDDALAIGGRGGRGRAPSAL